MEAKPGAPGIELEASKAALDEIPEKGAQSQTPVTTVEQVRALNRGFSERLSARHELSWVTDALVAAARSECIDTAYGLARYLMLRFDELEIEDRRAAIPRIVRCLLAKGERERLQAFLLENLVHAPPGMAFISALTTAECGAINGLEPRAFPNGRPNALMLQSLISRSLISEHELLTLPIQYAKYFREDPQLYLLLYNAFRLGNPELARSSLNRLLALSNCSALASFQPSEFWSQLAFEPLPELEGDQLVSVLVAARNSEATIGGALRSLLGQSYRKLEVLVCDDASDDGTLGVIQELARSDGRLRVFRSRERQGVYNVRNHLLRRADGELITFHDADDIATPMRIASQVGLLERQPERLGSTGAMIRFTQGGEAVFFYDQRAVRNAAVSLMVRRSVFDRVPGWRRVWFGADREFIEQVRVEFGIESIINTKNLYLFALAAGSSLTQGCGTESLATGLLSASRRRYAELAFFQRLLGPGVIDERMMERALRDTANLAPASELQQL